MQDEHEKVEIVKSTEALVNIALVPPAFVGFSLADALFCRYTQLQAVRGQDPNSFAGQVW